MVKIRCEKDIRGMAKEKKRKWKEKRDKKEYQDVGVEKKRVTKEVVNGVVLMSRKEAENVREEEDRK